ncbi:hypothetical protein L5515_009489 [Caenorhabditis briggsae]|uniref:Nuclear Hormone Receptor family n=1 Tax=Caenorhabditis briggsae TaxID=6238 RepID=A0AAE9F498_CAEBR|nr:hypothetical protein L5515_009489 [Caenorhabditis briggsae]
MLKNSESLCHVCGSESNGMYHYGAQVCRACAAFFRRALTSPYPKKCRMNQKCDFLTKNGYFKCKFCRLKKCYDVGMSSENFQLNRDVHNTACRIPETVGTFLGRSNLIIFSKSSSCDSVKSVINLENLIEKAMRIMKQSPESPIFVRNSLEKLAFSLGPILKTNQNINSPNYGKIYGMDQSMAQIEHEILTVTKWLTHFDGFLDLAPKLQIQIFQACWNLWWKLERLATTAMEIRRNENLRKMKRNSLLYKFDKTRIDVSWLTRYSFEELKFFLDLPTEFYLDDLTIEMLDLNPTEIELSFMLSQLCFHYVGKRFQGEILRISEKFQQILADDLHDYYTIEMINPYYMKRLAKMMKINNMIQLEAYKNRSRTELAFVFDIFNVEISHSEIFRDY